jgi:hypothetical protein
MHGGAGRFHGGGYRVAGRPHPSHPIAGRPIAGRPGVRSQVIPVTAEVGVTVLRQ